MNIKHLLFTFFFFSLQTCAMSQEKATLIYIGDPMCSWCYGFAPELEKTVEELADEVDFEMLMGGLRPYNKQTMKDLQGFLTEHWEHVNEASGQPFSYEILNSTTIPYDTEPPSRAVLVVRKLAPEKELAFFSAVQTAFYKDNKNTTDIQTYLDIAKSFDIDEKAFQKEYESEAMKQASRDDFATSGEMGIRGFPSMVLKKGDQLYLISNGYTKAAKIIETVRAQLN